MSDHRYNGWSNYETWNVALWFGNDEGLYRTSQGWVADVRDEFEVDEEEIDPDEKESRLDKAKDALAERLEEWLATENPIMKTGMFSDLLTTALAEVDCREIAENWLED